MSGWQAKGDFQGKLSFASLSCKSVPARDTGCFRVFLAKAPRSCMRANWHTDVLFPAREVIKTYTLKPSSVLHCDFAAGFPLLFKWILMHDNMNSNFSILQIANWWINVIFLPYLLMSPLFLLLPSLLFTSFSHLNTFISVLICLNVLSLGLSFSSKAKIMMHIILIRLSPYFSISSTDLA